MPRGKRKILSRLDKQKQQTDARLMKISRKVEKYLYKNKSITKSSAQSYLEEMTTYTEICSRDPRSMQVLEKLTKMMKSINAEVRGTMHHSEDKAANDISILEKGYNALSPVYSLQSPVYEAEDTITQCSYNETIDNNFIENNITKIDLCSDDDGDDKNLPIVTIQKEKPILNLLKCISNMCIVDNGHFEPCNDLDLHNSPSILAETPDITNTQNLPKTNDSVFNIKNNVDERSLANLKVTKENSIKSLNKEINHCEDITLQNTLVFIKNSEVKEKIDKSSGLSQLNKKYIDNNTVSLIKPKLCNHNVNLCREKSNSTLPTQQNIKTNALINIFNTETPNTIQPKMVDYLKEDTKRSEPTSSKNIAFTKKKREVNKNLKQNKINKPRKTTKVKNSKKSVLENCIINDSDVIKNTTVGTLKNISVNTEKKRRKKVSKASKGKTNLPGRDIDNLSWLESIRYIRVVDSHEYETRIYDDNFWDDFTFPSDMNNQDFSI